MTMPWLAPVLLSTVRGGVRGRVFDCPAPSMRCRRVDGVPGGVRHRRDEKRHRDASFHAQATVASSTSSGTARWTIPEIDTM